MQKDNQLITLPMSSVNKLRCTLCNGYLSVPPVDLTRKVCGRCNTNKQSCEAYEEIAQYVLFPCIYLKCKEKIAWGKVEYHEKKCLHKTFMCPVESCTEVFEISSTSTHFLTSHKNLQFRETCPLEIKSISHNNVYKDKQVFLIASEQVFLVFAYGIYDRYSYKWKYHFGVFALNSDFNNNTKYEITLITYVQSQLVSYTQRNLNIIPLDKRDHCFKCIDSTNKCTATYYHKQGNNFLPINFNRVDMSSCTNISYQIYINHSKKNKEKADNKELSKKMECPICTLYMVAPIYLCDTGHSFCGGCKTELLTCPYCQAHIGDKRNFVLEELAETIKVNCINIRYGCEFLGDLKSVKNHEDVCTHTVPK